MENNKLELIPSWHNIYLSGSSKIIVWNTLNDKLAVVHQSSEIFGLYACQAKNLISKSHFFEAKLGSEEAVHLLCGFLKFQDTESDKSKIFPDKRKQLEEELEIVVTTTLGCNFACTYCCQGLQKDFAVFDNSLIDKIIQVLASSGAKKLHITWYGGEPLLHHKMIAAASTKVSKYCVNNNIVYSSDLLTNAYLLSTRTAMEINAAGITFIQISLDGSKRSHDDSRYLKNGSPTFDKIMKNIQSIEDEKSLNVKIAVRINIGTSDLNAQPIITDLLKCNANKWKKVKFYLAPIEVRLGTEQSSLAKGVSTAGFAILYQDFIRLAKRSCIPYFLPGFYKGLCTATKRFSMIINPNGDIHKCWDEIVKQEKAITTVNDNPIEILSRISTSKWADFDAVDTSYCSTCKLLPVCGGNCGIKHSNIRVYDGYHSACPPVKLMLKEYILDKAIAKGKLDPDEETDFEFSSISLDSLQKQISLND